MQLEDWLEKARGSHKYIRKYYVGGKAHYEYYTPGGQKVTVPSMGAVEAAKQKEAPKKAPEEKPAEPEAKGTETVKEAVENVAKKITPQPPTYKQLASAQVETKSKEENDRVFSLAGQVLEAAIGGDDPSRPASNRRAVVKACRALFELAKQPGNKGRVVQTLRDHLKDARAYAKKVQGRYNADQYREKPVAGRAEWTYDHVLQARGVRDLIESTKQKVQSFKATKKTEEKPTTAVKVDIPATKQQEQKAEQAVEKEAPKEAKAEAAANSFAQDAVSKINLGHGPYENNPRLRKFVESKVGSKKAQTAAIDQLALDALDPYSEVGNPAERKKLLETALSIRYENNLEGTHTDGNPETLMLLMASLSSTPSGEGRLTTLVKDGTTASERKAVWGLSDKIRDPAARHLVQRALAVKAQDDKYADELKRQQEAEAKIEEAKQKLFKPGDLYPGSSAGKGWRVKKATPKTITIVSDSDVDPGAKFSGRSYTFKWDGTGFKRQGQYLSEEGTVAASDFKKSMSGDVDSWLSQADEELEKSYDAIKTAYKKKYGADAWDKIDVPKDVEESEAKPEKLPFGSKTKLSPVEKHKYTEAKRRLAGSLGMPKEGWGLYGRSIVGALKQKEKGKDTDEKTEKAMGNGDNKPGESLAETSTEELTQTKKDLEARLKSRMDPDQAKALKARHAAISGELERRGGKDSMDKCGPGMQKACGKKHGGKDLKGWMDKAENEGEEPEDNEENEGKTNGEEMEKGGSGMTLDEWMAKAMPTHEARMGGPKSDVQGASQDGGDWEGKGKTPDNNGGPVNAAGTDAQGKATGSDPGKQDKLSEDDEEQGEIGAPEKKKPIEKLGKSELYPAPLTPGRQREMMAHDVAKLRKSQEMVTIGPDNHPYGYRQTMGADHDAMSKSEGNTDIPRLSVSPGQSLAQSHVLCKSVHPGGCDAHHSAMLTACPECGAGVTQHRIWPNSSEVRVIPQAGPGGLRPAKRDRMIKIH